MKKKTTTCKVCGSGSLHAKSTMCREHYILYHKEYRSNDKNSERIRLLKKEYGEKNRDDISKKKKVWYENNREKVEKARILRKYGVTREYVISEIKRQSGVCPICLNKFGETKKNSPCIDHDHVRGNVRGVICTACNLALGFVCDNVDTLGRMITYLMERGNEKIEQKAS